MKDEWGLERREGVAPEGGIPRLLLSRRAAIEQGLAQALAGDSLLLGILRYHAGLEDEDGAPARPAGKLVRPSLVLFVAEELGQTRETALAAAVALELVHEFSLVHDDIEDEDRARHGRPTAWVRYGIGQAINAGDLMVALAFRQVLAAGPRAAAALAEATSAMIEGQGLDLRFDGLAATVEEALEMERKKTGALFACAFRLGAIVAQASPGLEEGLASVGSEVGLAFQIRDDILGVWGNEEETGKPRGSDLRSGKSVLLPLALAAGGERERAVLERARGPTASGADLEQAIGALERLRVQESAERLAGACLGRARVGLDGVPLRAGARGELEELLLHLVGRRR
jgi:geranylgeranyl diphosphate synthase type I